MHHIHRTLIGMAVLLLIVVGGCSTKAGNGEHQEETAHLTEKQGEHDRDGDAHGGEHRGGEEGEGGHDEEGEESGTMYSRTHTYDRVRNGVRLILVYDSENDAFVGTIENTMTKTLERVRVEVHLSDGKELGPTTPTDLAPGEKKDVKLTATSKDFDSWNAHPEVGSGEQGHEGEGGEHDGEGREHDREG